ncbi:MULTISPECIES: hypothetical protein [unclassified Psychrobacter]|uniref:hypothetical protein n=1 Tax=unclassified Psychrobacter TaxID=196806 RepID=UPI000946FA21|nr:MULTISPECIES: hypothetical protein [unclassified Psychrobacter]OLF40551.1 hypothetical protein BTV99_08640 [Psychrobacter sp. Rd 27.2]PJX20828.1 hypothetical protein CAP50_11590 [Psychrobacter sp. L7]
MSKSTLALLDSSLYPQRWQQQTFATPQALLVAMLSAESRPDARDFTQQLLANEVYQDWINSSVFGRYLHRNFTAFYRQNEDSFNTDMPALFRRELTRHAQYLPLGQVLFFAGDMPKRVRQTKLLTTTVNPATAIIDAQPSSRAEQPAQTVVNQLTIVGKQVMGFPIRHNKRTSERTRNEVLILDFRDLRLVNEEVIETSEIKKSNIAETILLRYYELR